MSEIAAFVLVFAVVLISVGLLYVTAFQAIGTRRFTVVQERTRTETA